MGISFDGLKQYDNALIYYNKAIRLNPDDHHAYHNKALTLASMCDDELALEYYAKAMALNPKKYKDKVFKKYLREET